MINYTVLQKKRFFVILNAFYEWSLDLKGTVHKRRLRLEGLGGSTEYDKPEIVWRNAYECMLLTEKREEVITPKNNRCYSQISPNHIF